MDLFPILVIVLKREVVEEHDQIDHATEATSADLALGNIECAAEFAQEAFVKLAVNGGAKASWHIPTCDLFVRDSKSLHLAEQPFASIEVFEIRLSLSALP